MNAAAPSAMPAPAPTATFQHRHAAHCESGALANLLTHHGLPISEPMVFGLASAIAFAFLPFLKLQGMPLIAYRMPPRAIIKGLRKPLGLRFHFETFRSPAAGEARLNALLDQGHVVGLQTSVFWLPYFPEDMRFHFNAHNLLVYGRDGNEYLISDPVGEYTVRCAAEDLARARFAKGLLAPKGLLYYPAPIVPRLIEPAAIRASLRKTARGMLPPVPIAGVRGIRLLAKKVASLDPTRPDTSPYLGHIVRMQEEIGTGGAGFRFIYAAFLQEAADLAAMPDLTGFAERLMEIGDQWRALALAAARMVKGRDPLDPPAIAALLRAQAGREEAFFRELKACAA